MSYCNFCATGEYFDVDDFLKMSLFKNISEIFRRGQKRNCNSHRISKYSGFWIEIFDSEIDDLESQINAAQEFIYDNMSEIERLSNFPRIEEIEISMILSWFEDTACYPITLPPSFLLLAGKVGIKVTLYVCATSKEDAVDINSNDDT